MGRALPPVPMVSETHAARLAARQGPLATQGLRGPCHVRDEMHLQAAAALVTADARATGGALPDAPRRERSAAAAIDACARVESLNLNS